MQFVNNGLNIYFKNEWFNFDNWKDVKKITNFSNINVGFLIVTCVLIDDGKCKMQLLNNGFNMLKIHSSTHVSCYFLKC